MNHAALLLALALLFTTPANADNKRSALEPYKYFDSESVTCAGTSTGLTATKYAPTGAARAEYALMYLETAAVRIDFATATTTTSIPKAVGDTIEVYGGKNIENFRCIRTTSTSGVLRVRYGR